jgi:hypothetical protein
MKKIKMAKTLLEELTNYDAWQMEKYGNVVSDIETTPEGQLINSGLDELSRMAEWVFRQVQHNYMYMEGSFR